MSDNKTILSDLETKLLYGLANSEGPLLDNEPLILVLEETKSKSVIIAEAIIAGEETGKIIEEQRQIFIPAALRGSILFFVMTGLSSVSKMYEYSLTSYVEVFN